MFDIFIIVLYIVARQEQIDKKNKWKKNRDHFI